MVSSQTYSYSLRIISFYSLSFCLCTLIVSSIADARVINEDEFLIRNQFTTKAPSEVHDDLDESSISSNDLKRTALEQRARILCEDGFKRDYMGKCREIIIEDLEEDDSNEDESYEY